MQTLSKVELAFLAVIGYPELTSKALKLCADKVILFDRNSYPHVSMMWSVYLNTLKRYKKKFGLKVSPDLIAGDLSEAVSNDEDMPEEVVSSCNTILNRLVSGNLPTREEGLTLIQSLVVLDTNRKISAQVLKNADLETIQKTLDSSRRVMTTLDNSEDLNKGRILFNPFSDIQQLAKHVVRIPTGINFLDIASSGGGRSQELWLLLGPSSGGKSTFSVQYSAAQALMGNNTLWVTYEQSMEGDLAERLIANVTDCSLDDIRDIGFDNLNQEIQTKFWAAVNGSEDRLKVLDMTRMEFDKDDPADDSGIYSVWKRIKELKAEGWTPKTVLIDWFGAMMSMVGTITGQDLSKSYRFLAQHQIDIARKMVKDEDLMCIFTHQTDMQTQHAKPTYAPDKTNSKDMKDLCNYMDIVLTLGNRDKNNIQYFNAAKARKGSAVLQTVQMIGEKARFKKVEGWLPNRDGNFYNPSEAYTSDDDEDDALNETARSYSREIM